MKNYKEFSKSKKNKDKIPVAYVIKDKDLKKKKDELLF